ncbi:MAG: hypothetical protein WCX80_03650 [Patescibacteria group bacterium]
MANQDKFLFYWKNFLSLEKDLFSILEYIQIDKKNFKTFSIKNSRLILSVGGEIDGIFKKLCNQIDSTKKYENIDNYRKTILKYFGKEFGMKKAYIVNCDIDFQPWKDWNKKTIKNPDWWIDYNKVKHNREDNFEKANLKNILHCMAGLYIVLYFYNKEVGSLKQGMFYEEVWGSGKEKGSDIKDLNEDTVLFKLTY